MASDTIGNGMILAEIHRLADQLMGTPHVDEGRAIDRLRSAIEKAVDVNHRAADRERQEDLFGLIQREEALTQAMVDGGSHHG